MAKERRDLQPKNIESTAYQIGREKTRREVGHVFGTVQDQRSGNLPDQTGTVQPMFQ